jgi:predicted phage tail protein
MVPKTIFVERATDVQENWTGIATVSPGVNTFTDTPPAFPPSEYRYRVRSMDNNSVYSLYSNIGYTLPNPPTLLAAIAKTQSQIELSWIDNSLIESGFLIEVSTDSGVTWFPKAIAPAVSANPASFLITDLACDSTYWFQIKAQNSAGFNSSPGSMLMSKTGLCAAPDAPMIVEAVSSSFSVILKWSNVESETNYIIEQKVNNATWEAIWTSSGPDITSHTINGLRPGTTYEFGVIAVNSKASGNQNSQITSAQVKTDPAIFLPRVSK